METERGGCPLEKLIRRGAEADIFLTSYFGRDAVSKIRKVRNYRHPMLDLALRVRRTLNESRMLSDARSCGVPTPLIYYVDSSKAELIMQYLKGRRLKESLIDDPSRSDYFCVTVGRNIARLHLDEIIHGDLTVSNFIEYDRHTVAFIDFGLSFKSRRIEDYATDLHLLKQTLDSYYGVKGKAFFEKVLEGYRDRCCADHVSKTLKRIDELERRGRYARIT